MYLFVFLGAWNKDQAVSTELRFPKVIGVLVCQQLNQAQNGQFKNFLRIWNQKQHFDFILELPGPNPEVIWAVQLLDAINLIGLVIQ